MKFKNLAAALYLCITFITLSASVTAEQLASPGSDQYQPHETASMTNDQASLNLLDTVWILGFTVAGLVLLRKVQGQ